jgi:LMBR1 domain-containing protein 1
MNIDPFLLIVTIIIVIVMVIVNLYILVYFQHPDDKNTAYFPKFLVIFGLTFSEAAVLLLPLDVANSAGAVGCFTDWGPTCGGLNMKLLWDIVFMGIAFFLLVLIPFAIFYYEADDGEGNRKENAACAAFKMEIMTLICVLIVLLIMFKYMRETDVGVTEISQLSSTITDLTDGNMLAAIAQAKTLSSTEEHIYMNVTFPVYLVALIGFVGWFFFSLFGGIGMVAMPMDLILAFVRRPKFMPADVYAEQKLQIQSRTAELIEIGKLISAEQKKFEQEKRSRRERKKRQQVDRITMNKFKQMVYLLDRDYADLKVCHTEFKNHNVLIPWVKLFFGIISGILSFLWILHIVLFMMTSPPLTGFLNDYFIMFDQFFPLFGTLSILMFSMYLLICVAKGCFKFGVRCFCFTLHPMELGGTMMNSFLFNLSLILVCTIPVVQFSATAFSDYVRLSDAENLFGAQMKNLKFFKYFWNFTGTGLRSANGNVFVHVFFGCSLLTFAWLIYAPVDKASSPGDMRSKLGSRLEERELRDLVSASKVQTI